MAKYDVDRFETPPDEDLICCICQCVLDNPLESPCRHVFCKVCIETWLTNRSSCPNCRKRVRVSKLKPVLPIVRNMINRLLIVCENREHGCVEGIKLEMYDSHAQNCDFAMIKCLNTGCGSTVLRQNMLVHEQSCKYRLIMCKKGCGLPIPMEQARKHNCLAELKKSMAAMEDQYQQRLRDLETKLSTKIQALEDRLKSMEENCHQDQNSWGSNHSTEYATPEYANSEERDADIAQVVDYITNHLHSDEDNSFYYSGDEDEVISTPEYPEEQDGDYFEAPRDTNSDETSPQENGDDGDAEEDVVEEEVEERDSDSDFLNDDYLNSSNDSDGDLNDSLLDSSDGEAEPVQVYEVSPTSPSSDRVERVHSQSGDSSDDIFHMPSGSSPQSNSPDGNDVGQRSSHLSQSGPQSSSAENPSRGNQPKTSGGGRLSPHGAASFGSMSVEYNSSGRSSPHAQELVDISDHSEAEEGSRRTGGGSAGSERAGRRLRNYRGRNRERADTPEHEPRDDSGSRQSKRKKRGRGQNDNTSRGNRKTSRNSNRKLEPSNDQTTVTIVDLARRADDPHSSSDRAASSEAREPSASRDASQESRGKKRKQEYLYGIPLDEESDSSADPSWERASQEGSTDITISDEFSLSLNSHDSDSSPEVYEQFLTSLGSVPSSESDKTWAPGDPDDDDEGWESERDEVDESYVHDSGDNVSSHDDSKDDSPDVQDFSMETVDTETSQLESSQSSQRTSQESQRSSQGSRSRRHSPGSREDEGGRSSSRTDNRPNSESDSTGRSLEGSRTKRPLEVSSSESEETEEDHHPIWKRRRSGEPS